MTTKTWIINSVTPQLISSAANSTSLTVANLDATTTILLSSDAVGSATSIPLTAGSSLTWDRGKALYAWVSAIGANPSLLVMDSGGQFNNGVAVANALMASGLSDSIATATSDRIGIRSIGMMIDPLAPAFINTDTTSLYYGQNIVDASNAASLCISGSVHSTNQAGYSPYWPPIVSLSILWMNPGAGGPITFDTLYVSSNNDLLTVDIPVRSQLAVITISGQAIDAVNLTVAQTKRILSNCTLLQPVSTPDIKTRGQVSDVMGSVLSGALWVQLQTASANKYFCIGSKGSSFNLSVSGPYTTLNAYNMTDKYAALTRTGPGIGYTANSPLLIEYNGTTNATVLGISWQS